jgi:hypothetical protein
MVATVGVAAQLKLHLYGRMEGYTAERFRKDLLAGVISAR